MFKKKLFYLLIIIFLFTVSFIPRIYKLEETEIFPDEITWMVRANDVFDFIVQGKEHFSENAWWNKPDDTEAINLPSTVLSGLSIYYLSETKPLHQSIRLLPELVAARVPGAFLSSLFIVVFFFAVRKITKKTSIAIFSSLLLSFDPINIYLSRWFMPDSYLAAWMFLSLAAFLLIENKYVSISLSSFFAVLAFLTKPTGVLVLPILLLSSPKKFIISTVLFFFLLNLLWYGQDDFVVFEVFNYLTRQFNLSQQPFTTFFMGKVTSNPPAYYYLYSLVTRLPLLILFGFATTFAIKRLRKIATSEKTNNLIILFIFIYFVVFSLSTKKLGIRYIYPIYPWIYLVAGISLYKIVQTLSQKKFKIILLSGIIMLQVGIVINYFPDYYLYFNKTLSLILKPQKDLLPSLCLGAKSSIEFMEETDLSVESLAYLGCAKTVIPYYSPIRTTVDWKTEKYVVIEESFRLLSPDAESVEYYKDRKPIFINEKQSVVLSRIYKND